MSTWTAPVTFASTTLTASTMNTEVRDHLVFLKGFADLITNSTTADTGTATYLNIIRGSSTDFAYYARVTGDTYARWSVDAGGKQDWSSGSTTADVNLYRSAANSLATDDTLVIGAALYVTTFASFNEMGTEPGAPPANTGLIYSRDNGAGKTQIVARFPTGAVQVIATEP